MGTIIGVTFALGSAYFLAYAILSFFTKKKKISAIIVSAFFSLTTIAYIFSEGIASKIAGLICIAIFIYWPIQLSKGDNKE